MGTGRYRRSLRVTTASPVLHGAVVRQVWLSAQCSEALRLTCSAARGLPPFRGDGPRGKRLQVLFSASPVQQHARGHQGQVVVALQAAHGAEVQDGQGDSVAVSGGLGAHEHAVLAYLRIDAQGILCGIVTHGQDPLPVLLDEVGNFRK
jgi:hypothetical protein